MFVDELKLFILFFFFRIVVLLASFSLFFEKIKFKGNIRGRDDKMFLI